MVAVMVMTVATALATAAVARMAAAGAGAISDVRMWHDGHNLLVGRWGEDR